MHPGCERRACVAPQACSAPAGKCLAALEDAVVDASASLYAHQRLSWMRWRAYGLAWVAARTMGPDMDDSDHPPCLPASAANARVLCASSASVALCVVCLRLSVPAFPNTHGRGCTRTGCCQMISQLPGPSASASPQPRTIHPVPAALGLRTSCQHTPPANPRLVPRDSPCVSSPNNRQPTTSPHLDKRVSTSLHPLHDASVDRYHSTPRAYHHTHISISQNDLTSVRRGGPSIRENDDTHTRLLLN